MLLQLRSSSLLSLTTSIRLLTPSGVLEYRKLLSMPFKLVWNGLCGALLLWFINLVGSLAGFTMKITVIKALIAGFFGVPGALAVVLYELLVK